MADCVASRKFLQNRSYYLEALQQHKRAVALIIAVMVTAPLFAFTSLPPVEVVNEVPQEKEIDIPVLVNRTIEVEVNVTEEVVLNRTVVVGNFTTGGNIFLEPQPAPPLIDSDIVLCIDISGSMDATRMPIAQSAIREFVEILNQSNSLGLSNDRIALVSFAGDRDGNWTNDATVHADLDYFSNQTHISELLNESNNLVGNGWTDAWAGLNFSLELLLNNERNSSSLKSILFLTDGAHNTGPWGTDVSTNLNYTGFLSEPGNFSFSDNTQGGPYSESPVKMARMNDIKIHSIGLFQGSAFEFDENFLRNISVNATYGTFGEFFAGNDTLTLSEGFLQARDRASGWSLINSSDMILTSNVSQNLFSYNVTQNVRRLKWDLNWNNSGSDFELTAIHPNGSSFQITNYTEKNIIPVTLSHPKSVIFDYPSLGIWKFNISIMNESNPNEPIKSRLSSYEPPIFIESIRQYEPTVGNQTILSDIEKSVTNNLEVPGYENSIPYKILGTTANGTSNNQSVLFLVNVTNKNPLFTYHNITVYVLGNFTDYNVSMNWSPTSIDSLDTGKFSEFLLNLTFNEPVFLQGTIFFKVNCSEGFHDAVAQEVSLDYRITTQNITVETYTQEITTIVVETQSTQITIVSQGLTTIYNYNRQAFDTLKWGGFFVTFGLLLSFLAVYVSAHAYQLRSLAKSFRTRLFPDQTILELALQQEGISVAPEELSAAIEATDDLDQFGENIFSLTGKKLTPKDLIRLTSGVSTDQVITRLSFVTGRSPDEIASLLNQAPSVEQLISQLSLDEERFLDIITRDEQVLSFQSKIAALITPTQREISQIILNDDLDISKFRSQLRRKL